SYALEAANGQPARLVLELAEVDHTAFMQSLTGPGPDLRPAATGGNAVATPAAPAKPAGPPDNRPVIVIDPGHGGPANGTQAGGSEFMEKNLVLTFGLALRDRIAKSGKYRVVMTRDDDTFVPLDERVRIARGQSAALLVSIHADALPRGEGEAQGATIYTQSE